MSRVRFDHLVGLKISRVGVDVDAAGPLDLMFRTDIRSVPVYIRLGVGLPDSIYSFATLPYGKTFSSVPMSEVYWTPTPPGPEGPLFTLSAKSNVNDWSWPWAYQPAPLHSTGLQTRRFVDRIEVGNVAYGGSSAVGGFITAVVYDYE